MEYFLGNFTGGGNIDGRVCKIKFGSKSTSTRTPKEKIRDLLQILGLGFFEKKILKFWNGYSEIY